MNHKVHMQYDIVAVTASAHDGNLPENTIDGNLSTRWSANGSGQYITFDLGSAKTVNQVKAAWYNGDSRTSGFSISLGSDPASLTEVYSGTSSGQTNALESYSFTATTARYIRITGFGNSSNTWNSITEVAIFHAGEEGDGNEEHHHHHH
uniref:AlyQ n=1 Tax=Persicobacter sp. CCB-QB2 TaxID=1561025 RepID=UPI0018EA31E8|nr:Chain A, AlyQ [Persicobacter sp. CCB-QB2]7D2A_A Chain A, AlyQ [Persicobacter sp. CCB-QB2]